MIFNNKLFRIIIFLFFVFFISSFFFFSYKKTKINQKPDMSGCFSREKKIIQGDSMEPLLLNEMGITLLSNYYECGHPIERGDIIAYSFGGDKNPLIKIVKVLSSDEVEIEGTKLKVNGEFLKNSKGDEYSFTEQQLAIIGLYIKDKHIPENSFFIFGDNVSDSKDSRKFGAVSSRDFLGKFVIE
jgi:signal peptidase I